MPRQDDRDDTAHRELPLRRRHVPSRARPLIAHVTLFVVRHAETEQNASRVIQLPGAALSASGRDQARRLAERLARTGIARILSSDLARAVETARVIEARTGTTVELEPTLRERDFGSLRGVPYTELEVDLLAADYTPPNGESWPVFRERVALAWARIKEAAASTDGNIVVVTHGLVCRVLIEQHWNLAAVERVPPQWANTALTEIEGMPPWTVRTVNCVAHLA